MSQQGGPPQAGYNPYAVGAQPSGQPDPSSRLLGIINDANVGTGFALNNMGPLKGNVPISIATQKDRGFIGTFEKHLGVRTKVKFEGFEGVRPAEMQSQGHGEGKGLDFGGGTGQPPIDVAADVGLDDSAYEQSRQGTYGSKHAHKTLHNQMPTATEFIAPTSFNGMRHSKVFGENNDSGGGGGGGATYEQVFGAGMTIYQNGAVHMGFTPESMLGTMEPPNTPGMSRSREQGKGGSFGLG